MSNDIEHRVFWQQPGSILIDHYGLDNIIEKQAKAIDEIVVDRLLARQLPVKFMPICEHCKNGILNDQPCIFCKGTGMSYYGQFPDPCYDAKIMMDHSKIYMKPDENEAA